MKLSSTISTFIFLTFFCTRILGMEGKKDIEEKKIKATLGILGMQGAIKYDDNLIQYKTPVNLELYLAVSHDLVQALPIPTFPFSYIPTYSIEPKNELFTGLPIRKFQLMTMNIEPEKINLLNKEVEKEKTKNKNNE